MKNIVDIIKNNKAIVLLSALIFVLLFVIAFIVVRGNVQKDEKQEMTQEEEISEEPVAEEASKEAKSEEPAYYFIAIHNEPYYKIGDEKKISVDYKTLKEIIKKADSYNIKLTIMLSAQWADYIIKYEKLDEVKSWAKNGHEISAHHHSIYHGNWDGYTNYTKEEAEDQRKMQLATKNQTPERYLGTLSDFMSKVNQMSDTGVVSGCMNDERDKNVMPDGIIYDTCSGFATHGEVGTTMNDALDAKKGVNEYILTGEVNGIKRYWLSHFQIYQDIDESKRLYSTMSGNQAYGVIVHSFTEQAQSLYSFMDYVSKTDPKGEKSKTVSQIVTENLLPVKELSKENIKQGIKETETESGKCGDKVCDNTEKSNPKLCPMDCAGSYTQEEVLNNKCGDNVCDELEKRNARLCPSDCE